MTPAAPASITEWESRAMLSSPAPETPTITGTRPADAVEDAAGEIQRLVPESFGASPMMPRMVMPVTPQSR